MHLLSCPAIITHRPQFFVCTGPPIPLSFRLLSVSLTYPTDCIVNAQLHRRGRKQCLNFSRTAYPKFCVPSSSSACLISPLAGKRRTTIGGLCAANKWRPFRRRKTRHEVKKFLLFLVSLHRSWHQLLLQEGLYVGLSSALLGSEDDRLRRFLQGLMTTTEGGGRRRGRRLFGGSRALAFVAIVLSLFLLILLNQGNAANPNWVMPPFVIRSLKGVVSIFSLLFRRRRGAW